MADKSEVVSIGDVLLWIEQQASICIRALKMAACATGHMGDVLDRAHG